MTEMGQKHDLLVSLSPTLMLLPMLIGSDFHILMPKTPLFFLLWEFSLGREQGGDCHKQNIQRCVPTLSKRNNGMGFLWFMLER